MHLLMQVNPIDVLKSQSLPTLYLYFLRQVTISAMYWWQKFSPPIQKYHGLNQNCNMALHSEIYIGAKLGTMIEQNTPHVLDLSASYVASYDQQQFQQHVSQLGEGL